MDAKSKLRKARSVARGSVTKVPGSRERKAGMKSEVWLPPIPEDRDDRIECQRIVEGGYGGRNLPPYFDDYN